MTLLTLIVALVLEQLRPFPAERLLYRPLQKMAQFFTRNFNGGQTRHGVVAWCLMVLPPTILAAFAHYLLYKIQPLFGFLFNVSVLYYTMGFRHVSHFYTHIHAALRAQDLVLARELIDKWRGHAHGEITAQEVARLTIEEGLIASHRQVFALIICFVFLPGPSGAILYRMAHFLRLEWNERRPEFAHFGYAARKAFEWIDWIPARVSAMAFSIVGDFEDAVYCWRTQAPLWPERTDGILLASGAGALGVRLGMPIYENGQPVMRPEMGVGDDVDVEHMQSTIGLIRRALVLYIAVLLLLALAGLAG